MDKLTTTTHHPDVVDSAASAPNRVIGRAARLVVVFLCTIAVALGATSTNANAATGVRYLDCRFLAGSGSYSSPRQIGTVSQTTIVTNCSPLSTGAGFNLRYFSFTLTRTPSASSSVMTYYAPTRGTWAGVHPRLSWNGTTVKNASTSSYYYDGSNEGFYQGMSDLWAGTWRLGAEKLSSPLGGLQQTQWFNIIIVP